MPTKRTGKRRRKSGKSSACKFKVTWGTKAEKLFYQIRDSDDQARILDAADGLSKSANTKGKRLKGPLSDFRSLRVGRYRIAYTIEKSNVYIAIVGPRADVYEALKRLRLQLSR